MNDSRRFTRRHFLGTSAAALSATLLANPASHVAAHPRDSSFPEPIYVESNGIRMAVYQEGEGFPIVFSHGFPELAYSWRSQVKALAKAGFHAIAPDQRGYGLTQRPKDIRAYNMHELTADLVGILDHFGYEKAVFCGHDWGGAVVWNMPLLHPDRVAGVIGVNTAFGPRIPVAPVQMLRQMRGEDNYIVAFQEPGVADAILVKDVRKTFSLFMRANRMTAEEFAKLPADAPERNFELLAALEGDVPDGPLIMNKKELNYYVETYERTGFTGGINWYRNIDYNWETMGDLEYKVNVPCMYVGAEDDVVLPPSSANGIEQWVPDIEKHTIADCGHWTQQEQPEALNRLLVDFMTRKFGSA